MKFQSFLKEHIVYLDGGMGTLLQAQGLSAGEYPERWNVSHPEVITTIHREYFDAGSNVATTNTFGANLLKFSEEELEELVAAAVLNARAAREQSSGKQEKFIALDLGPTGKLLRPLGDLDFEEAVRVFSKTVQLGVRYGVDLILIETMNDSYETKAAVLAAKENSDLPVLVSNAYGEDGKLMTGATPAAMVAMLEGMGVDAVGANCSLGPKQLRGVAEELLSVASIPVLLQPNAGLPRTDDMLQTVYDVTADEYAKELNTLIKKGLRLVGGCCGTTPEYIRALVQKSSGLIPLPLTEKHRTVVSSYTHAVTFADAPILIGERINPTGKKRLKQALRENDMAYLLSEGIAQQEKGAHILDVNVGLPELDEAEMLKSAVCELQAVLDLPLQIDTADIKAMECALRYYNGKAMINSVNGKKESMAAVFPLVKKYGGLVVALTLDEDGIPQSAEGRVNIAEKILATAAEYGIDKKDIIFDTLAMTISADNQAALATLTALRKIKQELGCHTSLGVSNVSFGLPNRDAVNGTFFALALENGLSAAIMNPHSVDMRRTYYTYRALKGLDENCAEYIAQADSFAPAAANPSAGTVSGNAFAGNGEAVPGSASGTLASGLGSAKETVHELQYAIVRGLKDKAAELTKALLKQSEEERLGTTESKRQPPGDGGMQETALRLVNEQIIPALNLVGTGFEEKRVYLPQLLMSAEAAKGAFEVIKASMAGAAKAAEQAVFVIATVHGDIHDIGKNIVRLLLENYGFAVVDLGKDVPPQVVVDKVVELHAPLVGLSALMTTTVPAMEKTIQMLKEQAPWCKTIVGGAVLTQSYADRIGADRYAKDAMETVRYAQEIVASLKQK